MDGYTAIKKLARPGLVTWGKSYNHKLIIFLIFYMVLLAWISRINKKKKKNILPR